MKIERITLLGSSSGRNAGDAALIASIMDSIDETLGRRITYEIPTIRPAYIRDHYQNDTVPVGMMPWHGSVKMLGIPTYRSIMRTDLTLLFDAILFDRSLYNPLFNFMSTLAMMLPRAKKRGKKIGFFNVGTGPVNTPAGKNMLKGLAELADFITTRDIASEQILADLGVENPRRVITADAAVRLNPAPAERVDAIYKELGFDPNREFLAINVNRYLDTWADDSNRKSMGLAAFVEVYAAALDRFVEETGVPVLFVNTQHHDVDVAMAIMKKMTARTPGPDLAICNNVEYNHYEIKGVFSRAALLFGMRLHACILASSALAPTIGLNYQPKVKFYFDLLQLPQHTISFDSFTVDGLLAHLRAGWTQRAAIRSSLERSIPVLQERAHSAALFVKAIDEGGSLDDTLAQVKSGQMQLF